MSRSFVCALVLSFLFATNIRAGTIDGSTIAFGFGTGYAESDTTGNTTTVGTVLDGPGYLDIFHNVVPSGGSTVYTFNVHVTNITAAPVNLYHFQIGVSNLNHYLATDADFDSTPDYLDPDMDGDTVSNNLDNAPFYFNPSQQDDDGDQWGNAIDLRPSNAGVPLNQVGGAKIATMLFAPSGVFLTNSASGLGYNTPLSSDTFANWQFVGNVIEFSNGSLAPDATANFTLNIVVPDGLENGGFVFRQFAEADVPEPTSIGGAALFAIMAMRRRR